jgi:hypothetical protein
MDYWIELLMHIAYILALLSFIIEGELFNLNSNSIANVKKWRVYNSMHADIISGSK